MSDSYTRVIVAGSRSYKSNESVYGLVKYAIEESGFDPDVIVSGGAEGIDECGELYGKKNAIPVHIIPADWDEHGKSAGVIRNQKMAGYADALVAVWDGKSSGTKNMIEEAHKEGLPVFVYKPKTEEVKTNYER